MAHPETQAGEIFLRNCTPFGFKQITLKPVRQGKHAFTDQGEVIWDKVPAFVALSALERLPALRERLERDELKREYPSDVPDQRPEPFQPRRSEGTVDAWWSRGY
jgi:hypothetical protein